MNKIMKEQILTFVLILIAMLMINTTTVHAATKTFTNSKSISKYLASQMMDLNKNITFKYNTNKQYHDSWFKTWFNGALEETDDPKSGDYLRGMFGSYSYKFKGKVNNSGKYKYTYTVNVTMNYRITKKQNEKFEKKLDAVLDSLNVRNNKLSDYEKAKKIYDYVYSTVDYDYSSKSSTIFTAYGALINKKCVCIGYSQLIHRMLKEAGLEARIINSSTHSWNMVEINGKWYFIDATFAVTAYEKDQQFLFGYNNLGKDRRPTPEYLKVIRKYNYSKKSYKDSTVGKTTLSTSVYTYDGKVKKPSVTVKTLSGKIISNSNYTVNYSSGRRNPGKYKVIIKMKNDYIGTYIKYFKIK